MFSTTTLLSLALLLSSSTTSAQVTATGTNGVTNPASPTYAAVGSTVNQTSYSRLLSLNSVDDFCLFGPPIAGSTETIGNTEAIEVAWCTKPRNGARLIPDGAITSAKFIKTPLYVQISGFWDGTKVNIPSGDYGGELDPHGATGDGNPVGGNVTSNVSGKDVFYEEWMSFVSYDQFCMRICTAENANITAALQCQHTLDLMGCGWVMALGPTQYTTDATTFQSCQGDAAAGPGLYPLANGSTSTFAQRYTGTYTDGAGAIQSFTVGETVTPSAPAFIPATSSCVSYATISNGVNTANYAVTASPSFLSGGAAVSVASTTTAASSSSATSTSGSTSATSKASTTAASSASSGSASAAAATTSKASGAVPRDSGVSGMMIAGVVGVVGVAVGVMEVLL